MHPTLEGRCIVAALKSLGKEFEDIYPRIKEGNQELFWKCECLQLPGYFSNP